MMEEPKPDSGALKTEGAGFLPASQTLSGVAGEVARGGGQASKPPALFGGLLGRDKAVRLTGPETKLRAVKWFLTCVTSAYIATIQIAPNLPGAVFDDWMKTVAAVVLAYLGVQYLQRKDGIGPGKAGGE